MTTPSVGPGADQRPQLDHAAVLAALQDQLDDLVAAMEAQQRTIDTLTSRVRELEQRLGEYESRRPGEP